MKSSPLHNLKASGSKFCRLAGALQEGCFFHLCVCARAHVIKARASWDTKNLAGEAVSDIRAVHVLAPSWKEVIESGDSSSATSIKVFLTLVNRPGFWTWTKHDKTWQNQANSKMLGWSWLWQWDGSVFGQKTVNGRPASAGMPAGETAGDSENDLGCKASATQCVLRVLLLCLRYDLTQKGIHLKACHSVTRSGTVIDTPSVHFELQTRRRQRESDGQFGHCHCLLLLSAGALGQWEDSPPAWSWTCAKQLADCRNDLYSTFSDTMEWSLHHRHSVRVRKLSKKRPGRETAA